MPRIVPVPIYPPPLPMSVFPVNHIVSPTYPPINGTKLGGSCSSGSSSQSSRSSSSPAEGFVEQNDNILTGDIQLENLASKNDQLPMNENVPSHGKDEDCIVIGISDSNSKMKENDSTSLSSLSTTSEGGSGSRSSPGIPTGSNEPVEATIPQSSSIHRKPDEQSSATSVNASDIGRDQSKRNTPKEDILVTKDANSSDCEIILEAGSTGESNRPVEGDNAASSGKRQYAYGSQSDASSATSDGSRPRPVSASHVQPHNFPSNNKRPPFHQPPYQRPRPHSPSE